MESRFSIYSYQARIAQIIDDNCTLDDASAVALKSFIDQVMKSVAEDMLKMTQLTILCEAFYSLTNLNPELKNKLLKLRQERWGEHFGTPTVTFLLTYSKQIKETADLLIQSEKLELSRQLWQIESSDELSTDHVNQVVVDAKSLNIVTMPEVEEKTGQFIKTHNPAGGFTTTPSDPVSQKFIDYASAVAGNGGTVLEIGAAFGAASLQALAKGARVFCNDIDVNNLAVVKQRYNKTTGKSGSSITGDDSQLVLAPGSFPEELAGLPKNFFDAILICRVLHFFTGAQIEKSLAQLAVNLKSGGKLFIVCETPYLKNWQRFTPEFDKRVEAGMKWPGELTNPADYESSGRAASLPSFVHWITKEVLNKSLIQASYEIEHLSYIDRLGQFPEDLLFDGRESVGAVAAKA